MACGCEPWEVGSVQGAGEVPGQLKELGEFPTSLGTLA